jgi:hypothetical protein
MVHQTEPIIPACNHNALDLIRSMTDPETIEAAVHENSKKSHPEYTGDTVFQIGGHIR